MNAEVVGTGLPLWLVISVVIVALVVGASMIAVVLGKYAISKWFHVLGGPMLSFLGVVLIGLSVFGNVKLKVGEFEGEINRLQTKLEFVKEELVAKNNALEGLSKALAANDQWPDKIFAPGPLDTPEELAAKAAFDESVEACNDVMKGQRSFCRIEALNKFQERMGW